MSIMQTFHLWQARQALAKALPLLDLAERRMQAANAAAPLPAGFIDHREDLKSAGATIGRVAVEMRRAQKARSA